MKEIANTIEKAKEHAFMYVEVPPHADFEIRWSAEPPMGPVIKATMPLTAGTYKSSGPVLIACLTD